MSSFNYFKADPLISTHDNGNVSVRVSGKGLQFSAVHSKQFLFKKNSKQTPTRGQGGSLICCYWQESYYFCELAAHANFQNILTTPFGRIAAAGEKEEEKYKISGYADGGPRYMVCAHQSLHSVIAAGMPLYKRRKYEQIFKDIRKTGQSVMKFTEKVIKF